MLATGHAEHEPVRVAGRMAGYQAGYLAALTTMMALRAAELRGSGEHVDVSMLEALTHNIDARLTQLQAYQYSGRIGTRSTPGALLAMGLFSCADAASGIGDALAFMLDLRYRERTGRGLLIELATVENMVPMLGEFLMDYTLNGRQWEHMGNEHWWLAPHNIDRCQHDNMWVTIVARNDEEFRRLCAVMLRPELANDPRFVDNASRYAHRRALDAIIGAWTANADARWLMHRLQREGIPAGVVNNEPGILDDPQHRAREFFQAIEHPSTGRQLHPRRAWCASKTPWRPMRHPPRLDEDNAYVYRELLGFSDKEYRRFEELGHIGLDYDPSVP